MEEKSISKMKPEKKCALLLIAVGVQTAAQIMKNLSEEEVGKISVEVAKLKEVPANVIGEIVEEFYQLMSANRYIVQGGMEYAKKVLESAWGYKKAEEIVKHVEASTELSAFSLLQTVDNKQLIQFLSNEQPQTTALILANLKPKQAASILSDFPEERQAEVAYRLATMGKTSPDLIRSIEAVLKEQVGAVFGGGLSASGGVEVTAEILNLVTRSAEKNILDNLKMKNPELADEISRLMFLFEDIAGLSDIAVQRILKEVDTRTLALALKTATEKLKGKIFKNMSERAADMLKEEIQLLGPVRLHDVEEAQRRIVDIIHHLEESGDITISRAEEEELIV